MLDRKPVLQRQSVGDNRAMTSQRFSLDTKQTNVSRIGTGKANQTGQVEFSQYGRRVGIPEFITYDDSRPLCNPGPFIRRFLHLSNITPRSEFLDVRVPDVQYFETVLQFGAVCEGIRASPHASPKTNVNECVDPGVRQRPEKTIAVKSVHANRENFHIESMHAIS
jgi:hypothetical protein